jgi:hypothetical protein
MVFYLYGFINDCLFHFLGAAALLFADLANHILVFTPQVTITNYQEVKRKDFPGYLKDTFKDSVISAVNKCKGSIKIHYGDSCMEDVEQISCLMQNVEVADHVSVFPHAYDDHVLSIYLKEKGLLKQIVGDEIKEFLNKM